MSTAEPTPGLWSLWSNENGGWSIEAGDSAVVCQRADWNHRAAESTANGRLFMAARELLAAAKKQEAAEAFHLSCDACEGNEIPELCEACFPHYDDARIARRNAIAKATIADPQCEPKEG
jgi:hypothetical protein